MFKLLTLCITIGTGIGLAHEPVPQRLFVAGGTEPFWIALSSVVDSGNVNTRELDPATLKTIQSSNSTPSASSSTALAACPNSFVRAFHPLNPRPYRTLDDMVRHASAVYAGEILQATPGFSRGLPVTLLQVQLTKTLRTAAGFPKEGLVYVEYPAADFEVLGRRYCNSPPSRGFTPASQDGIVIFAYQAPSDAERKFLYTAPENLIFLRSGAAIPADRVTDADQIRNAFSVSDVEAAVLAHDPQMPELR